MTHSLPRRVIPSSDVLFRELEGEAVMLDLGSERYFGLDEVGARVWQLLDEHHDVDAVVAQMLAEYEVEEEQLRSDLAELIANLAEAGLVTIEDDEASAGPS
ncbi:MAG: PqqD family protein [Candidatus Promineifilaceae bacterium]|nr:PqqD family protein [Candidatus Promineifilaceae bacterium]